MLKNINQNTCMDCGIGLAAKKRYPVYSARLAVLGYKCEACNEKSKSPGQKKREEEISKLTKEVPKLENPNMDIRKSMNK